MQHEQQKLTWSQLAPAIVQQPPWAVFSQQGLLAAIYSAATSTQAFASFCSCSIVLS